MKHRTLGLTAVALLIPVIAQGQEGAPPPAPPAPPAAADAAAPAAVPAVPPPAPAPAIPLDPKTVGSLTIAQVDLISADTIRASPVEAIQALSLDQLKALSDDAQKALSEEQVASLTEEQKKALAKSDVVAESDTPAAEYKRGRAALKPGIRLVGDAYSQLVAAADDVAPGGAFGAGIEVETMNGHFSFIVRKGVQPGELSDRKAFGTSLLTPSVQDFYAGIEGAYDTRLLPRTGFLVLSGAGFAQIARTSWKATLAPAVPEVVDPETGDVTTPGVAATTATSDATTVALSLGPELKFVAWKGENYVEIRGFIGGGLRAVSLDRDANDKIDEAHGRDSRVPEAKTKGFLKHAIGTDRGVFASLDSVISLRINSVVITAAIPYVGGNVTGLSGLNFVPSITLRTGAELIGL